MNPQGRLVTGSVFISVGHYLSPKQARLVELVENQFLDLDITPIVIKRHAQMISDPISTIRNVIRKTKGTVVIAFERCRILEGIEFPQSANPTALSPRSLATVWNQIEAAMTLQIDHPLLVLAEEGIYKEGVMDQAIHPSVSFRIVDVMDELPEEVRQVVREWCARI
jgi:hypothetical protein